MSNVKEQLLAAATRLFASQGYATTSVAQICDKAGVSKGALYHHFDAKDDILYGIYEPLLALQMASLQRLLAQPLPVAERLYLVAEDVARTCLEQVEALTVFVQSMHLLKPETRALVSKERRRYHQAFAGLIEEAQRHQVIRCDVHPDLLLNQLFGPIHYSTTWYRRNGRWAPDALAQQMASMWLEGIQAPGARQPDPD